MICNITKQWMKEQIDFSNKQASINRNYYPIQEQDNTDGSLGISSMRL